MPQLTKKKKGGAIQEALIKAESKECSLFHNNFDIKNYSLSKRNQGF